MSLDTKNPSEENVELQKKEIDVERASSFDTDAEENHLIRPSFEYTELEEKALWRRVDLHVMPILAGLYLASFLDRSSVSLATPMPRDCGHGRVSEADRRSSSCLPLR